MIDCLKLNSSYCGWGNFDDYMCRKGDGWDAPIEFDSPEDLKTWKLDDLNEMVNFYFDISRNISTARKNGCHVLDAIQDAFAGIPFIPSVSPIKKSYS